MHTCRGCDTLPALSRTWHGVFCRSLDAADAGRWTRANLWGWVADRLVRYV